jgi:hypothetical protein
LDKFLLGIHQPYIGRCRDFKTRKRCIKTCLITQTKLCV